MSTVCPWEVTPVLHRPRLLILARFAVEARQSALADAKRSEGDTNWGIGCRAYERFIHKVTTAAESGQHPWLALLRLGLSITLSVENILVRAYTGRADRPDMRHVLAAQGDADPPDDRQLTFLFNVPEPEDNRWVWLMAVETDMEGHTARVVFFQADPTGRTRHAWEAPMAEVAPQAEAAKATRASGDRKPRKGAEPRRAPETALLFGE